MKVIIILFLIIGQVKILFSGVYNLPILNISPYTEEAAMGEISIFRNDLTNQRIKLTSNYMSIYPELEELNMYYTSFGYFKDNIRLEIIYLDTGKHPITEYNPITESIIEKGSFHTYDIIYGLNILKRYKNFIFDGGIKLINTKLYHEGKGMGIDFRIGYWLSKYLKLQAGIENLGSDIKLNKGYEINLPLNFNIGLGVKTSKFTHAYQLEYNYYDKLKIIKLGMEWKILKNLSLMWGYFNKGKGLTGMTYGIGLNLKRINFTFANLPKGALWATKRINRYSLQILL